MKTTLACLALLAAPPLAQAQDNCTSPNSNDDYILGTADGTATGTGACQMANVTGMRSVTAQFALDGVCGTSYGVATLTPPPTTSLCSAGSWGSYSFDGYSWAWKCNGTNGGAQASCQAPKGYTVTPSASASACCSAAACAQLLPSPLPSGAAWSTVVLAHAAGAEARPKVAPTLGTPVTPLSWHAPVPVQAPVQPVNW